MGTPDFAVPALEAVARSCDVARVVTQPDRPRGRGLDVMPSAVANAAERLGLPVTKPAQVNDPFVVQELRGLGADLFAVVAFGSILGPALLAIPRLGSINLHGSLLPDYRGASPVQRALWDGLTGTGVTTLWMDEGIDTGDVILQRWCAIESSDDAGSLARRLAELGGPLLAESLVLAGRGAAPRARQDRTAGGYARKLAKSDGVIDWALDAVVVWNRQRAVTPWPGAATSARGRHMIVTRSRPWHRLPVAETAGTVLALPSEGVVVACAPGALLVERIKPEGRAELAASDWCRGARLAVGDRLGLEKEAHA
jgi:methionyl-tRNA formyltransferase